MSAQAKFKTWDEFLFYIREEKGTIFYRASSCSISERFCPIKAEIKNRGAKGQDIHVYISPKDKAQPFVPFNAYPKHLSQFIYWKR